MKKILRKFIPIFILSWYHFALAFLGAFFYGFPSRKLIVIGVTGTSGKSTVVELTAKIFEEAGLKTASLSSIRFKIGKQEWENRLKMTMPGRFKLQKFLRQAVKARCKYLVLEVTSEGIKQHRHKFINFNTAVFTNLSHEHIESHGSFKKYRTAKVKLFKTTKNIHIINIDDKNAEYFLRIPAKQKIEYSIKDINLLPKDLKLLGKFNLYNAIAVTKIGLSQKVSLDICKKALEKVKGVPGRMEMVIREPFIVIVDYAHTPDALEKVYKTASKLKPATHNLKANLICVLGACGGGRDKWKRPVLGKLAAKYCQKIIITNEDPYDENPMEIINQVAEGAGEKVEKILDRKEAIKRALKEAKANDIIIITGKGCEPWMCVEKGKKISWDDRRIVKEELKNFTSSVLDKEK